MKLWGETMPYANPESDFVPEITEYKGTSKGAIVVFAGGGYGYKAEHEGPGMGEWLQSIGMTAFVVDYRVAPDYHHPAMICDAQRAVRYARTRAAELGFDKDKIAVMGFSAGGHLAGTVSVHGAKSFYEPTDAIDEESAVPNASILCYPVIDMYEYRHDGSRWNLIGEHPLDADKKLMSLYMHVTSETPQAFIWHTATDQAVPIENSLLYADALAKVQVPFELHVYPVGPHGLGLAPEQPHVAQWTTALQNWLKLIGFKA